MTSHTFDTPEEFRRQATLVAEQFSERLAQLLTHCFNRASSGEKLPDLFDETASLGRELLVTVLTHSGAKAKSLDRIEHLYIETASTCRELAFTIFDHLDRDDGQTS